MPLFSRRRLRSMLDELSLHIDEGKRCAIAKCIESKNSKTALAYEAELAFLWALTKTVNAKIEPAFAETRRRPDAFAAALFPSAPAVLEVRAISDDHFSGKDYMNRTAEKIIHFANTVRRRSGLYLHFEFGETSYHRNGHYHRVRLVDPDFSVTPSMKIPLQQWLKARDCPNPRQIRIKEGITDVVITCHERPVHPQSRTFCRMPAVSYHLEDNPVFKALKDKAGQFSKINRKNLRCVILFDTGSYLLRQLRPLGGVYEIGGDTIIWHALHKLKIDLVCVFSPAYDRPLDALTGHLHRKKIWKVTYFDARGDMPAEEYNLLERLASQLPRPALEGYQARSLHEQGVFRPGSTFGCLAAEMKWSSKGPMTIKVSTKRIHLLLAGKISPEEFTQETFRDTNPFASELEKGYSIRSIAFESAGLDADDDYAVFELDFDFGNFRLDTPERRSRFRYFITRCRMLKRKVLAWFHRK